MLALIQTLVLALDIYWWLIIASAIFSWLYAFNVVNPRNQVVDDGRQCAVSASPSRRCGLSGGFLPDLGGIDISPIILLLLIFFVRQFLIQTVAPAVL